MTSKVEQPITRPNLMRPECGLVAVSEWTVETPERQRATVDAFAAAWANAPWPQGLLTCSLLCGNDGRSIVIYGQWTNEESYRSGLETHLRPRAALVDQKVPGIVRSAPDFYRLHRSRLRDTAAFPGCIVLITFEFESPDHERQKQFISNVFRVIDGMPVQAEGAIGGHFHASMDGLRVLNFAEWANEASHRQAIEGPSRLGSGPDWESVRKFPGLHASHFQRFTLGLNLAPPSQD
ncbi:antibiotic biosynthesis monooxygenase [uncultured Paludibaculum sp.]|uniref:antibiotic biosynthesis monooxygenase n=1 Tax=uncultured Paludibaculum sp. TaxID=1765020 RepID=UPI002AAC3220|nr:antibiotic biosynthesis monooxygenase [uncultured Paludibaculum sp.]